MWSIYSGAMWSDYPAYALDSSTLVCFLELLKLVKHFECGAECLHTYNPNLKIISKWFDSAVVEENKYPVQIHRTHVYYF